MDKSVSFTYVFKTDKEIIMKKTFFLLIILFNSFLFSEEYVCSSSLKEFDQPGVEIKTYERSNKEGFFLKFNESNEKQIFYILEEDESYIMLVRPEISTIGPEIFVTFINKENNTFYENFLFFTSIEELKEMMYFNKPLIGTCIVKN